MNNIELRLIAEQNWRQEELLRCKNIRVKKQPSHKTVWEVLNSLPTLLGIELCYHKQILKN